MCGYQFLPAHLFKQIVVENSSRNAVLFGDGKCLTYGQLNELSNRVARFLQAQGVSKGDRVAFCLEKCASAYGILLAALKIGAPYIAVDPRNPPSRLQSILNQCAPKIFFCQEAGPPVEGIAPPVLCPPGEAPPDFAEGYSSEPVSPPATLCGSDPAYLMFTSGSTGKPKGAVMSQDNLFHFIGWCRSQYGFVPGEIHTHLNPLYFDNSVFDIYSTFFTGGALVPFTDTLLRSPLALARRVRDLQCEVWFSVPSLLMFARVMKVATPQYFGSLRKIIFGGEGYPRARLKELWDALGETVEYHNVYGPTECTCICSTYRIARSDLGGLEGYPPLGRLISNFRPLILEGDQEVAPGEVGELCLAGPCVGLGYFGEPELTRQAFVQNPTNRAFQEIIYRSGDLVRFDPNDGKLHFVSRKDNQIKRQGYRIELEEIQHALTALDGVEEACVVGHRQSGHDEVRIVAVVAGQGRVTVEELKKELAQRLPRYMMPDVIHLAARLPKNANGKTDRQEILRQYARDPM